MSLARKSIPELEDLANAENNKRADFVRIFGAATWLFDLLGAADVNHNAMQSQLRDICSYIYQQSIVNNLYEDCPCNDEHDRLYAFNTAFIDSDPLLIMQKSRVGKLFMAYRFLISANDIMAMELEGRLKTEERNGEEVINITISEAYLTEIVGRAGRRSQVSRFVRNYLEDVRLWSEGMESFDAPHLVQFAENYDAWRAPALRWVDMGADAKLSQHVTKCSGKIRDLNVYAMGYLNRCNLCCFEVRCQQYSSLCREQADG